MSVDQKPFIAWFVQTRVRLMALAIGDGVNDVGMIRASHVSVGIRGTESHLAAQAASFRASEWKQLRRLARLPPLCMRSRRPPPSLTVALCRPLAGRCSSRPRLLINS